jgi:hypothetical protein
VNWKLTRHSRKGIADEILANKEEERNPKKSSHRRSRSRSAYSSDSVSTISTNRSPSRSPPPKAIKENGKDALHDTQKLGKRGRRSVSSGSDRSGSSHEIRRSVDRNTRRRMSSFSPPQRGRRRSRSRSGRMEFSQDDGALSRGFRRELSGSRSRSRSHSGGARQMSHRSRDMNGKRPIRLLSISRSRSRSSGRMDISDDRHNPSNGDARAGRSPRRRSPHTRHISTSRSRSRSPRGARRSRVPRSRSPVGAARSPSPFSRRAPPRSPGSFRSQNGSRGGRGRQFDAGRTGPNPRNRPPPPGPAPQRERSLSPYSKRVALTRQIQG